MPTTPPIGGSFRRKAGSAEAAGFHARFRLRLEPELRSFREASFSRGGPESAESFLKMTERQGVALPGSQSFRWKFGFHMERFVEGPSVVWMPGVFRLSRAGFFPDQPATERHVERDQRGGSW